MISGIGFGLVGLFLGKYYIEGFLNYSSYIIVVFIHADILLMMLNTTLKRRFLDIIAPLLALAPVVTFLLHQYNSEFSDSTGIALYSLLLLPALLYQKRIIINIVGLVFVFINMILYGASGKLLIFLIIILVVTIYLSFKNNLITQYPFRAFLIRIIVIIFLILIPAISILISEKYGGSQFIVSKIHQVKTLNDFIFSQSGVESIAPSPYVRVTSLINILYEGLSNPLVLLFGKGFGGYFQDHFQYFAHLDLSQGGFADKSILTGHFYSGHDTIVTVPMFNGIIGLFLILKLVWVCIFRSHKNYLLLASIPFLLLVFYFDTLIGVTGVLILYLGSGNAIKYKT